MKRVLIDATFLENIAGGVTQNALYLNKFFQESENYDFFWLVRPNQSWWLGNINQSKTIEIGISSLPLLPIYNFLDKINLAKIIGSIFKIYEKKTTKEPNYDDYELTMAVHQNPVIKKIDIYFIHDLQHLYFPENFSNRELEVREFMWKRIAQESKILVVESEKVKNDLIRLWGIKQEKIVMLETKVVDINTGGELENHDKIDNLIKQCYIVYPANEWEHKNHRILIEAMKLVNSSLLGEKLKLVLIGRMSNKFKRWVKKNSNLNSVYILDYVSEVKKNIIIKNSLFVIIPSFFESKSLVLKEAIFLNKFSLVSKTLDTSNAQIDLYSFIDPWSEKDMADKILKNFERILQKHSRILHVDTKSDKKDEVNFYFALDELVRIKEIEHGYLL